MLCGRRVRATSQAFAAIAAAFTRSGDQKPACGDPGRESRYESWRKGSASPSVGCRPSFACSAFSSGWLVAPVVSTGRRVRGSVHWRWQRVCCWSEKPKTALTAARGFCKLRKSWSKVRFRSETKPGRRRSAPGPGNQIPIPLTSRLNMKNEHKEDLGLGADLQTWMRQLNRRRALKLLAGATLMSLVAWGEEGVDLSGMEKRPIRTRREGARRFRKTLRVHIRGTDPTAPTLWSSPGLCAATFVPASPEPRAWRRAFCSPSTSPW